MPIFTFYPETRFGGDFKTEAAYKEVEVECLILSGGLIECFEEPEDIVKAIKLGEFEHLEIHRGWIVWPLIPYSFDTSVDVPGAAPLPPSKSNILGTDDVKRCSGSCNLWISHINNVYFVSHNSFKYFGYSCRRCSRIFWRTNRFTFPEIYRDLGCGAFLIRNHNIICYFR